MHRRFRQLVQPHQVDTKYWNIMRQTTVLKNGLFSKTTWVSDADVKPVWILVKQEMVGWQWHQLDDMQIICTLLQTDNHASAPHRSIFHVRCSRCTTNSVKALKAG